VGGRREGRRDVLRALGGGVVELRGGGVGLVGVWVECAFGGVQTKGSRVRGRSTPLSRPGNGARGCVITRSERRRRKGVGLDPGEQALRHTARRGAGLLDLSVPREKRMRWEARAPVAGLRIEG